MRINAYRIRFRSRDPLGGDVIALVGGDVRENVKAIPALIVQWMLVICVAVYFDYFNPKLLSFEYVAWDRHISLFATLSAK